MAMSEEQKKPGGGGIGGIGDGIRTGIGILSAFKDAIEETLDEAVKRGDLSSDRAGQTMRDAASRIQETFDGARDRFDFVSRREYDELKAEIGLLRDRIARLEGHPPPDAAPPPPGIIITE
jgi:polyhydroxyalkanoate synthesis regulator phasin